MLLGGGGINTGMAPNIHFCSLRINMNNKNILTSGVI